MLVRLGKRPGVDNVRARAYVAAEGRHLALKVWAIGGDRTGRSAEADRERRVRRTLSELDGYPVPDVVAEGAVEDTHYLLEPVVFGSTPQTPSERIAAAVDLLGRLAKAYAAAGVTDRPLSTSLRPDFTTQLEAAVSEPWFPWLASGDRSRFLRRVGDLVARNRTLPSSLGHGDMTMSNVIRDEHGVHWLVDWEQGGVMPGRVDVRKLLFTSGAPGAVLTRVAKDIRAFDGRGVLRYRFQQQLALGVCNELAVAPRHRAGAERANRLADFEAKLAARVAWVTELLE